MSKETKKPCDLHLPKDYKDDLDYRQPKPVINSTDTSDNDEDRQKSGETTPINTTTSDNSTPSNPFTLLQNLVTMANQGTGANTQQLGDGTSSV
jgi:hypothetical protein